MSLGTVLIYGTIIEMLEWMWKHIQNKSVNVQKAFYLHFYFDDPLSEIAKKMGEKESTVKTWIYRTKKQLYEIYWKEEEILNKK